MTRETFRAEGLAETYRTGETTVQALRGVDLSLFEGELAVLLGPSGSGKSTLLNILGGLDHPTAGRLFFEQRDITALNDADLTLFRRTHIGFVFQFYNLIPSLTARENVAVVTAIARAIAKRPRVLLCDEPTGALDSKTGVLVLRALASANEELGTTTAVITHNAAIAGMADRVIRFGDGAIAGVEINPAKVRPEALTW